MDLLSLLTGSENLYKYLLLGGIGMLVLSLFYPLNQEYILATKKDLYNNEVKLLNLDIEELGKSISIAKKNSDAILDSLSKNNLLEVRKKLLKDSVNRQYDSLLAFRKSIKKKELEVEFNKVKIDTLQSHIKDYNKYENLFFWSGIISAILGIIGWYRLMKKAPSK